jgi:hypothetical protein
MGGHASALACSVTVHRISLQSRSSGDTLCFGLYNSNERLMHHGRQITESREKERNPETIEERQGQPEQVKGDFR